MKWPWQWVWSDPPESLPPPVSDEQRAELAEAQEFLASQTAEFDAKLPEINRVTTYIRREVTRNHLAEKFRIAFGGDIGGQRH